MAVGCFNDSSVTTYAFVFTVKDPTGNIVVHHIPQSDSTPLDIARAYQAHDIDIGMTIQIVGEPHHLMSHDGHPLLILKVDSMPKPCRPNDIIDHLLLSNLTDRVVSCVGIYVRHSLPPPHLSFRLPFHAATSARCRNWVGNGGAHARGPISVKQ